MLYASSASGSKKESASTRCERSSPGFTTRAPTGERAGEGDRSTSSQSPTATTAWGSLASTVGSHRGWSGRSPSPVSCSLPPPDGSSIERVPVTTSKGIDALLANGRPPSSQTRSVAPLGSRSSNRVTQRSAKCEGSSGSVSRRSEPGPTALPGGNSRASAPSGTATPSRVARYSRCRCRPLPHAPSLAARSCAAGPSRASWKVAVASSVGMASGPCGATRTT